MVFAHSFGGVSVGSYRVGFLTGSKDWANEASQKTAQNVLIAMGVREGC